MLLPDGTPLASLNLDNLVVLPRGVQAAWMGAWFWPWPQIVVPISAAQRTELAQDGLLVIPLLAFHPSHPERGGTLRRFAIAHEAEAEAG